jgi:hypothetical protein
VSPYVTRVVWEWSENDGQTSGITEILSATTSELKQWFESATQARFDVTLMGQATWYLQSRITQETDYSIVVDQTRYAAPIVAKYMPASSMDNISAEEKKKFGAPLPNLDVMTKADCSTSHSEVLDLQAIRTSYRGATARRYRCFSRYRRGTEVRPYRRCRT